jgi:hypothetical protein
MEEKGFPGNDDQQQNDRRSNGKARVATQP